tara:strand:- start:495 stop:716 length:222 start_codon:yes stop_codon:yes gene_type:complete
MVEEDAISAAQKGRDLTVQDMTNHVQVMGYASDWSTSLDRAIMPAIQPTEISVMPALIETRAIMPSIARDKNI